ncbi:fimbrial biogenesis outer membrane usher protein [Salmonella enterica subsp. enterica serovar Muenchen]|nr:fimbrial biogenesis outer membrane usher protein [Salmonella enterica subsp. enterica]EAX6859899.1 fimbrial biogenesis outer membrane usher protein [Salmonella enterica]ECD5989861.1 fimbrial biogenesis outer membrane usher protein [Salmonella enterica subsp. enterica serovar Muenchen]EDR7631141.1 fimbrial biogenesis outer membrane usher protein [Salmonella enterica subsp. enterica]
MNYQKISILIVMLTHSVAWGRTYSFDNSMITGGYNTEVDVSLFNQGLQLPGRYYVSIYINGKLVDKRYQDFRLRMSSGEKTLQPCMSPDQLTAYGIDVSKYPELSVPGELCIGSEFIPQADVSFNFNQQRLSVVVPQQALLPMLKEIAPESLWDDGVPAILMNYQVDTQQTTYRLSNRKITRDSVWLQPGANMGAWRFRSSFFWQKKQEWQRSFIYAERGINHLRSRIMFGESYSSGFFFNSIPFRGGKIWTDESMLPHDQWSWAPVIRGISRTQARVEVKQNGYLIANNIVPPGPFELTDIPASNSQGILDVTVYESDGSRQYFRVPYDTPVIAVRQGYLGYRFLSGQYRASDKHIRNTPVNMLEARYGLPRNVTVYVGTQVADHYQAGGIGLGGMSGRHGAVSADLIRVRSKAYNRSTLTGQRFRLIYDKSFERQASLNVTTEFMDRRYATLSDVLDTYRDNYMGNSSFRQGYVRHRTSLNIGVSMEKLGYMNFSGAYQNYRNGNEATVSYGASWSKVLWDDISMNVGWSKNQHFSGLAGKKKESQVNLWLSIPLRRWINDIPMYASLQMTRTAHNEQGYENGIYGYSTDRRWYWDVREQHSRNKVTNQTSGSVSVSYRGTYGEIRGNYSSGKIMRQAGGNVNGKILFTHAGITAGQNYGDTVALIKAPGAPGLSVGYLPGVSTDFRGYAVSGALNAYRKNTIDINPALLPENVSLLQTSAFVVPTKGAVVEAPFRTLAGRRVLLTLIRADGRPVPFGAVVSIGSELGNTGIVGDGGEAYMSGVPQKTKVNVRWGKAQQQSCSAKIILPDKPDKTGIHHLVVQCVSE